MNILYPIGRGLYVNLTNRCSCNCTFCLRNSADGAHGSDTLWLEHEPSFDEVIAALNEFDRDDFDEVIFCGYGEPTERFDLLLDVAREIKKRWGKPLRIDTNGQGSLINERDIAPELDGVIDKLSISLNAPNAKDYQRITRSRYGESAYPAMLEFTRKATEFVPDITMTTVGRTIAPEQEAECQKICDDMGVRYRVRPWVD